MSNQHNTSEPSEGQQQTRERIITAASKVLAEKGYKEAQAAMRKRDLFTRTVLRSFSILCFSVYKIACTSKQGKEG